MQQHQIQQSIPLIFQYYKKQESDEENDIQDEPEIVFDIHTAIKNDELENIKKYFNLENINQQDSLGKTPLMHALKMNRRKIAKYLLKKGADINILCKDNKLPFHYYIDHERESDSVDYTITMGLTKKLISNQNINMFMTKETFDDNIISMCLENEYPLKFIKYLLDFDIDFKEIDMCGPICIYLSKIKLTLEAPALIDKVFTKKYNNFAEHSYRSILQLFQKYRYYSSSYSGGYIISNGVLVYSSRVWNKYAKNPPLKITKELFTTEYCVICDDDKPGVVYLPCHHKVVCNDCYQFVKDDTTCCFCRTNIKKTIIQ